MHVYTCSHRWKLTSICSLSTDLISFSSYLKILFNMYMIFRPVNATGGHRFPQPICHNMHLHNAKIMLWLYFENTLRCIVWTMSLVPWWISTSKSKAEVINSHIRFVHHHQFKYLGNMTKKIFHIKSFLGSSKIKLLGLQSHTQAVSTQSKYSAT